MSVRSDARPSGRGSDLLRDDLAHHSASTWDPTRHGAHERAVPPELVPPPRTVGLVRRLRALRTRHLLRRRRAEHFVAGAMSPDRGLPIATARQVVTFLGELLGRRRGLLVAVLLLNAGAALASLFVPRLLGDLVDRTASLLALGRGSEAGDTATRAALVVLAVVALQAALTFGAKLASAVLGQGVLAEARESVVRAILRLPLSRVEQAASGDLVTRVTRDAGTMSDGVRWALPEAIIASVMVLLTVVAMVLNSPLLALPTLVLMGAATLQVLRYLRRAPAAYLLEGDTYSRINTSLTETVEGARTVEALRLGQRRRDAGRRDIAVSGQAERYGMTLRNLLFIVMDLAFSLPRVLTLALGAIGYERGWVGLGQITAAMLYIEAVWGPFDMLVHTIDRLQVALASTTRLLGVAIVPADREVGSDRPADPAIAGRDLRFAYRAEHDVLHGVSLDLTPGERLAVVGPSGSGKSTLGRLLAGINGPRTGSVTVGGVEITTLPLDVLRTEVSLVTQEHHVFVGSVRDNVGLARDGSTDAEVEQALRSVDAWSWVESLPAGLDTTLGAGHQSVSPGRAQQIALARLVLADPHTLVLDEATSLIDPRTAQHLEGSMNALLTGRTVVAIAHRLHTAHDADRIAVVIDGRVAELGSHDELVALDGEYARLWEAWTS
ncbi:ABC transporter ATP-binding protein/permease [Arsenicicoccus piscis]|uniref:Multidrug ABC transporter ATP-binding protein n=1 Tax=Arsenicicoccus piscis TaxID=673954 RepID=A0ABQ6HLU2_9MICO|nr:ABC transporter ATP-binding protein [Arsenicicoccus piscis]MCH8628693.1 ABC transporter ATP-binding protein/permease [Arsenicicoccus piscis]GMA19371.1 multidrug ABC transporter ATP-binding protein [Arsenicicoccus piscis]